MGCVANPEYVTAASHHVGLLRSSIVEDYVSAARVCRIDVNISDPKAISGSKIVLV
jgi:hypothetical protein